MESRERALAALNHVEGDRVPYDLSSTHITGINTEALARWMDLRGVEHGEVKMFDLTQQLGVVPEEMLEGLGVDFRGVPPEGGRGAGEVRDNADGSREFTDEWGLVWRMPAGGYYFDMVKAPLAGAGMAEVKGFAFPDGGAAWRVEGLREKVEAERAKGVAVCLRGVAAGIFELSAWLMGFADFYMALAAEKDVARALLRGVAEVKMAYWEKALGLVGDIVDVVVEADDLAGQFGPIASPESYREMVKPLHREICDLIRAKSEAKVFLHSCGSVRELLPDIVEAGFEILNPVQVSAAGMDTAELKRDFGDTLVFWGGVDTQRVLPYGTPEEVKDEVRRRIETLAPGGGFVLNSVHNVQRDVPAENLEAMWEALGEYGSY